MFEKVKRERILFLTGAISLALAVLVLTIIPFIINNFVQDSFVSINGVKFASCIFYFVTLLCFLFSQRYINIQINWIIITLVYYILFQILVKIIM